MIQNQSQEPTRSSEHCECWTDPWGLKLDIIQVWAEVNPSPAPSRGGHAWDGRPCTRPPREKTLFSVRSRCLQELSLQCLCLHSSAERRGSLLYLLNFDTRPCGETETWCSHLAGGPNCQGCSGKAAGEVAESLTFLICRTGMTMVPNHTSVGRIIWDTPYQVYST